MRPRRQLTPVTTPAPKPRPVDPYKAVQTAAQRITSGADGFASFTLLDRVNGRRIGDPRSTQPTFSESTIKAWLAADLLATRAAAGVPTPYETARMTAMIQLSDDNAAEVIWRWLGGGRVDRGHDQDLRAAGHHGLSGLVVEDRDLLPRPRPAGRLHRPREEQVPLADRGRPLLALMRSVDPTNAFGIQQATLPVRAYGSR